MVKRSGKSAKSYIKLIVLLAIFGVFAFTFYIFRENFLSFTSTNSAEIYFTRPIEDGHYMNYSLWRLDLKSNQTEKIVDIISSNYDIYIENAELFQISKTHNSAIVGKDGDIFLVNLSSGEFEQLTNVAKEPTDKYYPTYATPATISADGNLLAFEITAETPGAEDTGQVAYPDSQPGLWVIDLTTREMKGPIDSYHESLTSCCGNFEFTQDGKFIVKNIAAEDSISIINIDTKEVHEYEGSEYSRYATFNSEHTCALIDIDKPFSFDKPMVDIIVTNGNLSNPKKIVAEKIGGTGFPALSPNCKLIAFESSKPFMGDVQESIAIYDIKKQTHIMTFAKKEHANGGYIVGWLPDNNTVIYVSEDNGDIYAVDVEGQEEEQLTNFGDIDRGTARIVF